MIAAQITPPPAVCSQTARDLESVGMVTPAPGAIRPRWHVPKEAAALVGASTKTILRAVNRGELPALRFSRKDIRITPVDLAAWYASKRTGGLSSIGSIANRGGRPWGASLSAKS